MMTKVLMVMVIVMMAKNWRCMCMILNYALEVSCMDGAEHIHTCTLYNITHWELMTLYLFIDGKGGHTHGSPGRRN